MDEDEFMNLGKNITQKVLPPNETGEEKKGVPQAPTTASPVNSQGKVTEIRMMTMTTWRVYPNGQKSHPTSKTWFTDKSGQVVKKKAPKKIAVVKPTKVAEQEVY